MTTIVSQLANYVPGTTHTKTEAKSIWISDAQCQIYNVDMPIKQARQIVKALPFALEEQIAEDVDNLHIVYLGKEDGKASALVVNKQYMDGLFEHQIQHAYYLPLALPFDKNSASLAVLNDQVLLRLSEFKAYSIQKEAVGLFLQRFKNEFESIQVFGDLDELIKLEMESENIEIHQKTLDDLNQLIQSSRPNHDLMSGPYKVTIKKKNPKLDLLKTPLTLAAALFICAISINWIQAFQLDGKSEAVKNASKNYYEQLFPGESAGYGMKRMFRQKLEEGELVQNGETFTRLLSGIGNPISSMSSLELLGLRYNQSKATLEIELNAPSIAELDKLKKSLEQQSYTVEIAAANNQGGKIKGLLKVNKNG
ncbi:hypothetical protein HF888_08140 [Bermanella marisrubri]|uniref:Type II secretion system protein L n=1 Tax=Bermanella marisrubri TaxID=207949 RepID=Q1N4H6_9GAMM|nr:type II secretion system protein GspL [Bermanella marisrubri]EAT13452.1 Type II secretory pathway, component PulL [Oceanobacter sp. RED65] [Bermanella marisrubri]QIZ84199.1 hypothetical protein HF888_08140 [Bermanella marisrubri]